MPLRFQINFYVKDVNGNTLGSSGGWRGYASYGGPWGSSLSVSTHGNIHVYKNGGREHLLPARANINAAE